MTEPTNPAQPHSPPSRRLDEIAAAYGLQFRVGLFVLAALLAAYPVYYAARYGVGSPLPARFWWLTVLAAGALATALVNVFYDPAQRMSPGEKLRLVLILLGGLTGICTAAFGLALPFTQYSDVFGGGFAEWRKNPGPLFWTALPVIGGLVLTFVSLLFTSGMERTSAAARRLLYGYNAVLSCLLLLFIFLLLNVLPYSGVWPFKALAQTADWTSSGLYSLSQATKERLVSLNQPVKVYVLLSGADQIGTEVETLMQNSREVTNRISWETLSPEINRRQVGELLNKYPDISDPYGMLVIYGTEPNATHEFIPRKDLFSDTSTEDTPRFDFKGEPALVKALTYLSEGKKSVVYFTQGHGELDLNNRDTQRPDTGVGLATDKLTKSNYDVKPLTFEPGKAKVPDDADVVVVARPRTELPADDIAALRNYVNGDGKKKGKLFVLFDVVTTRDGKMVRTGLEQFLAGYGVRVGDDRLIAVANARNPEAILTIPNPESNNPIARAFFPQGAVQIVPFLLKDVRTVTPAPPAPASPGQYSAESLLLAVPDQVVVAESDLAADPAAVAAAYRKDRDKLLEKIRSKPTRTESVAVTVTEGKGAAPPVPGHEFMRESQPRMVVFGDASWVSNSEIAGRNGDDNYDLFSSCVNWLRERPDLGTQAVGDKTRTVYRLAPDAGGVRLLILPALLILVAVSCLGTGVWLVRRR